MRGRFSNRNETNTLLETSTTVKKTDLRTLYTNGKRLLVPYGSLYESSQNCSLGVGIQSAEYRCDKSSENSNYDVYKTTHSFRTSTNNYQGS